MAVMIPGLDEEMPGAVPHPIPCDIRMSKRALWSTLPFPA